MRPLPGAHRYHGMLYGVIVGGMPLHVLEHASQIASSSLPPE